MAKKIFNVSVAEQISGDKYSNFVNVLLFIFPVVINSVKVAGDFVLFVLALSGLWIAISHKISPFKIKELKVFSWLTLGYFSVVVLSVLFSGKAIELMHFITRELHFLFAPFIGIAFYTAKTNINYLLSGIKLGLMVLGAISLYQYGNGILFPSGVMNGDVFANLAVMLLFLSVTKVFQEGVLLKLFTLVGVAMGLIAIILSGTRGAWLSCIFILFIYLFLIFKQGVLKELKIKALVLLIIAIVAGLGATTHSIQSRTTQGFNEFHQWVAGENRLTSVGMRMEMYKATLVAIQDLPLFGYGYRNANPVVATYASKETLSTIANYNHLHNAYLTNLAYGGVFGLVALLLMLFVPLRAFMKQIKPKNIHYEASMGVLLSLGFASFGIVNILFGDVFMNAFYVFFLAFLLPTTCKDSDSHDNPR